MAASSFSFWEQHRQTRLREFPLQDPSILSLTQRIDLRDQLLSEAELLATLASEFKLHANRFNPNSISRVPSYILLHVFRTLAEEYHPRVGYHATYLGWITVGHVCHLWRQVLLGACELWANDIGCLPSASAFSTFVERAGQYERLQVKVDWFNSGLLRATSLPPAKLQSLTWHIHRQEDANTLFDMFIGQTLPRLQNLDIQVFNSAWGEPIELMPSSLSRVYAPNLTRWKSHSFYLPLRGQALTKVDLSKLSLGSTEILDILAHAPHLEYFSLTKTTLVAASESRAPVRDQPRLNLRRLFSFDMQCPSSSGAILNREVIAHLDFPATVILSIDTAVISEEDFELLITMLRGAWPQDVALAVHLKGHSLEIRPSRSLDDENSPDGIRMISFSSQSSFANVAPSLIDALRSEFGQVNLLILAAKENLGDPDEERLWTQIYSMFPGVEEIDMRDGDLLDLQVLGRTPEHLLPQLQRLRLTKAMKAARARTVEHLYGVFHERISAGAGPNELWLDGVVEPSAGDTDAKKLRALVPKIHWSEG